MIRQFPEAWIQTYRGRRFWPLEPHSMDVDILDIAHSLSMQCRFGGHTAVFYSVAEHCIRVANELPDHLKLAGLMHDAAEAYLLDVPTPLKKMMGGYADAEKRVMTAIAQRYDFEYPVLSPLDEKRLEEADMSLLLMEAKAFMRGNKREWFGGAVDWSDVGDLYGGNKPPLNAPMNQPTAEMVFLEMFKEWKYDWGSMVYGAINDRVRELSEKNEEVGAI